jgi:hypothetical protein
VMLVRPYRYVRNRHAQPAGKNFSTERRRAAYLSRA